MVCKIASLPMASDLKCVYSAVREAEAEPYLTEFEVNWDDESMMKLFYLVRQDIGKQWTMRLRDWKLVLSRFTIQFEERMPLQAFTAIYTKFRTFS